MGSELVNSPAPLFSYTEEFNKHFPYYLSIGMTYDQFWNEDCQLVRYYREADKLRQERRNQEMWLQGLYIYDALCRVSPVLHAFAKSGTKPVDYPDKPYALTQEAAEQEKEAQARANRARAKATFEAWAQQLKLNKKG